MESSECAAPLREGSRAGGAPFELRRVLASDHIPSGARPQTTENCEVAAIGLKSGRLRAVVRSGRREARPGPSTPAQIAQKEPFPITPLPSEAEARSFLSSFGLTVQQYVDEEKLLIVVSAKDASVRERGEVE